jgi:hypothetical protein
VVCGSGGDGENSISTCGCKDANARLDECCLCECGAVMFRRTSEKTRCPGGQKCGVAKDAEVCQYRMDRKRSGAPDIATDIPDYCTSTRRLRSRMYFPSLYFWDCSYALSCQPESGASVSRTQREWNGMGDKRQRARSHISSRVWSCTCSNRCLARCGCL